MKKAKPKIVAVSGGFDPVHVGHAKMFEEARKLGDYLVVILNNDNWLRDKKGFVFMPEEERYMLIGRMKGVDAVYITDHKKGDKDRSVCAALRAIKPTIFANGGDRRSMGDIPEAKVCKQLGIQMVFDVGGGKIQSSSWLTGKLAAPVIQKPWGFMQTYRHEKGYWLKTLTVKPGARLSLQRHRGRSEMWVCVEGKAQAELRQSIKDEPFVKVLSSGEHILIPRNAIHRLSNPTKRPTTVVEIALGKAAEDDIVRYEDDYGRTKRRR